MVVVNLTRSRAENLGNVARGLELLPPGGTLVVAGAKSDGVDSLARAGRARRCRSTAPSSRRTGGCSG